ncbi:MAG TPA: hypothetical protein PKM75_00410, partial [Prolixibacteraceae bacterium]|nr:hypothetical protein [Prolixibacteraceae bacterium]
LPLIAVGRLFLIKKYASQNTTLIEKRRLLLGIKGYCTDLSELSLSRIRFLVMNITETHIQDRITNEIFPFRSPTKDIRDTPWADLISKWKLLPHETSEVRKGPYTS